MEPANDVVAEHPHTAHLVAFPERTIVRHGVGQSEFTARCCTVGYSKDGNGQPSTNILQTCLGTCRHTAAQIRPWQYGAIHTVAGEGCECYDGGVSGRVEWSGTGANI